VTDVVLWPSQVQDEGRWRSLVERQVAGWRREKSFSSSSAGVALQA
jgi:hypothetical protein